MGQGIPTHLSHYEAFNRRRDKSQTTQGQSTKELRHGSLSDMVVGIRFSARSPRRPMSGIPPPAAMKETTDCSSTRGRDGRRNRARMALLGRPHNHRTLRSALPGRKRESLIQVRVDAPIWFYRCLLAARTYGHALAVPPQLTRSGYIRERVFSWRAHHRPRISAGVGNRDAEFDYDRKCRHLKRTVDMSVGLVGPS
jgi:hypothetical protein